MATPRRGNPFFNALRERTSRFEPREIVALFGVVNEGRVNSLADSLVAYISKNLPAAFEARDGLADYRTNPYVLMTTASVMNLSDPFAFGTFLLNSKLYMALETSFGKAVESTLVGPYPIGARAKWSEAPEKLAESAALEGLSREQKARKRVESVWREIDRSCVVGTRRYLASIKSGPSTINDTQVQAMTQAIIDHHRQWATQTKNNHPGMSGLDIVIGLTYGTDKTTNNKENQILVKLLDQGFIEEDRRERPGVLIDAKTKSIRVYRLVGRDFWSFIGNPAKPADAPFVFLEVLLGLAKALSKGIKEASLEDRINRKIQDLATALGKVRFPRGSLPAWVRDEFSEAELFWFATSLTAFFDEGI